MLEQVLDCGHRTPVNCWLDGSLARHAGCQRAAPPPRQSASSAQYCHNASHHDETAERHAGSPSDNSSTIRVGLTQASAGGYQ
jgi:hypothetical protein